MRRASLPPIIPPRLIMRIALVIAILAGTLAVNSPDAAALFSTYRPAITACSGDTDCDGISDAAEENYANSFKPLYVFHPNEGLLSGDPTPGMVVVGEELTFLWQVSQATCSSSLEQNGGSDVVITYLATYGYDYINYEGRRLAHNGDTERTQVCVRNNVMQWVRIFRHAHVETNSPSEIDLCTLTSCARSSLATHPVLWISEGKHASYRSEGECDSSTGDAPGLTSPVWTERCGRGTTMFAHVDPDLNVGEWWRPNFVRFSERPELAFLNGRYNEEFAWAGSAFGIGGLRNSSDRFCAGDRSHAPDSKHLVVRMLGYGYESPWCAGSIESKWHRPPMPSRLLSVTTAYLEFYEHSEMSGSWTRTRPTEGPFYAPSVQNLPDGGVHDKASYIVFNAPTGINATVCEHRYTASGGWSKIGKCLLLKGTGRVQGYDLGRLFSRSFDDRISSVTWHNSNGQLFWPWFETTESPLWDRIPASNYTRTLAPIDTGDTAVPAQDVTSVDQSNAVAVTEVAPGADSPDYVPPAPGYWMLEDDSTIYGFGAAASYPSNGMQGVALTTTPNGEALWALHSNGVVTVQGTATHYGDVDLNILDPGETVSAISAQPDGTGYWVYTNRGRAIAFGSAAHYGDMSTIVLNGPVVASAATPTGLGYYMIATDGGVFAFGDAQFAGSMGGIQLNQPVVGIAPDPDNDGYWLVAADGGIFSFNATFKGSMGGTPLNGPVIGAVAYADGYLLVASDGGIFAFSNQAFLGSLGSNPPDTPIRSVAAFAG